ncbi:hypothetical protein BDB01DRAFT_838292 [Pilobolus umbonatus]|nr:hypothetical protein BDB01DRAFT_838292 [Pilobolus umbonatus]
MECHTATLDYDPSHKTSSVTSIATTSSWDSVPSLYTGRAESVSSRYDYEDLQEPDAYEAGYPYNEGHKEGVPILLNESEQNNFTEFLDSFFNDNIKKEVIGHEVPSSSLCHPVNESSPEDKPVNKNRELLSDDQKRANHIASEQKRRNTIRGGFKELTEIIPTLKNISNSKSTILFKSVDYIKQLEKRNKSLRDRLLSLQSRLQQRQSNRQSKKHHSEPLSANAVAALMAHKNQQKQLEALQEQLRVQQALLAKHNIHHPPLYPSKGVAYHSISIPTMDDTPTTSTHTSPTLPHASLYVHNNHTSSPALVMPASVDDWLSTHISSAPAFNIPADEDYHHHHHNTSTSFQRILSSRNHH